MASVRSTLILIAAVVVGSHIYQNKSQELLANQSPAARNIADQVLGSATQYVIDKTNSGTEAVQNTIYKTTASPLVREFHKLPILQQEEIKKQICNDPSEDKEQ